MLKIIIPIAGSSALFINAGYSYPKPLIEINGVPMIQRVIEDAGALSDEYEFIFIMREEEALKFHLDNTLKLLAPRSEVIKLKRDTKGGLCSVLMAIDKIDDNDSLVILNGDQILDVVYDDILSYWKKEKADAGVITFKSVHPRWSYARIESGLVVQTAEKNPISNSAIVGYYYFENAGTFFRAAFQVIKNDVQLEGNFYISPVINEYVLLNKKVLDFKIKAEQHHSFYSPQMIEEYEKNYK
ncbi:MAG: glycosyltransferase family 2 protein [Pedobacter sp.]